MLIGAPETSSTRARSADWLELNVVAAGPRGYGYASLLSALQMPEPPELPEIAGDPVDEEMEPEILDAGFEEYCDELLTEMEWRADVLGPLYPFRIVKTGPRWIAVRREDGCRTERAARVAYLTCLMISALRYDFVASATVEDRTKAAPDILQVLAVIASRALVGGPSFWMGHPRPEKDGFEQALGRFVAAIGVGTIKDPPPVSELGKPKDGSIDVIAWRQFADGRPAPIVSYGQVASGKNWRSKAVTSALDGKFLHWLSENPARHHLPAMYIPFVQHEDIKSRTGVDFEALARDAAVVLEKDLGVVIDRLRLTELIAQAVQQAGPDDQKHIVRTLRWVSSVARELQGLGPLAPEN